MRPPSGSTDVLRFVPLMEETQEGLGQSDARFSPPSERYKPHPMRRTGQVRPILVATILHVLKRMAMGTRLHEMSKLTNSFTSGFA